MFLPPSPGFFRSDKFEAFDITSIDTVFTEKYKDELADASDSDGYLSEVIDLIHLSSAHVT